MAWLKLLRSPKSLRWRYSLRALLIFITLFMLWGGYHTNHGWKERAAEAVLTRQGFGCSYGPQKIGEGTWSDVRLGYDKVVQGIWRERFIIDASITAPPDRDVIDALAEMPYLESLSLLPAPQMTGVQRLELQSSRNVSPTATLPDGVLADILAPHQLHSLVVSTWILSDADCNAIGDHKSLEVLNISGCQLSESGFAQLISLPRLRQFTFTYCKVTGRDLDSCGSESLVTIEGQFAPAGKRFAQFVSRCPQLTTLRCFHRSIDDEFVTAIGPHSALQDLNLGQTVVSDGGFEVFKRMPRLRFLTISSPELSSNVKATLQSARPQLRIQ